MGCNALTGKKRGFFILSTMSSVFFELSPSVGTGQVSAWQSATLPPISYKLVQPGPAWVEEPQSSSGGV